MNSISLRLLSSASLLLATAIPAASQGRTDYLNFEAPQVEPVAIARVGTNDDPYLLVCNTPDNRVEIYDISSADSPVLEARVAVGLEPVSVAFKSFSNGREVMYTADWLGDTVTAVELFSSSNVLTYKMLGSFPVNHTDQVVFDDPQGLADEPVHVLPVESGSTRLILVAKRFGSSISILDAFTGDATTIDPDGAGSRASVTRGGIDMVLTNAGVYPRNPDGSFPSGGEPTGSMAVKEPQCILASPTSTGRFWVLAQQGGGSQITFPTSGGQPMPAFNLDLWSWNLANPATAPFVLPTTTSSPTNALGTTNFSAVFDSTGAIYAVGTEAQNGTAGDANLSSLTNGFAPPMLYRIKPAAPLSSTTVVERNVSGSSINLGQITDIDMYEPTSGTNAGNRYVIAACFTADRWARIRIANTSGELAETSWGILSVAVPMLASSPEMAGPRGVAVNSATHRGYFLNAVDNSIFVANLDSFANGTPIALQNDPLPTYIRQGRKFLYSNVTSATGDSCSKCHIDGRSDQLLWRLSAGSQAGFTETAAGDPLGPQKGFELNEQFAPVGVSFLPYNSPNDDFLNYFAGLLSTGFPATGGFDDPLSDEDVNPKGPLITQALQGLMNFEVEADGDLAHHFSNAPYHWRGDKHTFLDFQAAFVDLQAQSGVTDGQMEEYEEFVNSIHYPPNAVEPITRHYSGAIGDLDDVGDGNGAQRGFKIFHIDDLELFGGRTCSQCHEGTASTDNRWTTVEGHPGGSTLDPNLQPLNTAALRGLRQKEGRLEIDSDTPPPGPGSTFLQTGDFGTGHDGLRGASINSFVGTTPLTTGEKPPVSQFIREFDSGVAPIVGRSVTVSGLDVDASGAFTSMTWKEDLIEEMEHQARLANCGVAVHVYDDDGSGDGNANDVQLSQSFWYKVTELDVSDEPYKEENSSTLLTRQELLDLLNEDADCATFMATPLGSERRVASLSGDASVPSGTPTSIDQIGTNPNTANADGVGMTVGGTLNWTSTDFDPPTHITVFEAFRAACQGASLITTATDEIELPRRLRFTGVGLQEGGRVLMGIDMDNTDEPDLEDEEDFQYITLPIYPTDQYDGEPSDETRIWETAVEFEPATLYMFLLGGSNAPGVAETMNEDASPPAFDPGAWNLYSWSYVAPSGSSTTPVLDPLEY